MAPPREQAGARRMTWIAAVASLAALLAAAGGIAAYYTWGGKVWTDGAAISRPAGRTRIRRVVWTAPDAPDGVNTRDQEYEPALSPDGKALYFVRGLPGRGADVYVARRGEEGFGQARPVDAVNTLHDELGPRPSPDGRFLLFYSNRPGGEGGYDIWASPRTPDGWGPPVRLPAGVNSPYDEYSPALTPDSRRLIFATNRAAGEAAGGGEPPWSATIRLEQAGDFDLYVAALPAAATTPATRPTTLTRSGELPAALRFTGARAIERLRTPWREGGCCVSPAGDFLYFASDRPGGRGGLDLYRCRLAEDGFGPPENLGPELNTDANEADPHLAGRGFVIHFSSDRPGGSGGWDVLAAESREVFALRRPIRPPQLSWSVWALLAALAVLVPLLLLLRAAGYRHLSLFQKCVALSLLAHIGLTILLSLFFISRPILQHIAEAAGLTTAVNLELSHEVQMRQQLRQQVTELPVSELPVTDPALTRLPRPEVAEIAPPAPEAAELNVPRAKVAPAPRTVQPAAPRRVRPAAVTERVSLPAPPIERAEPALRLELDAPVLAEERRPEATPDKPAPAAEQKPLTTPPALEPVELDLAAARVRPDVAGIVEAAAPQRPRPEPPTPSVARPAPPPRLEPDTLLPRAETMLASQEPTTLPGVVERFEPTEAVEPNAPAIASAPTTVAEAPTPPRPPTKGESLAAAAAPELARPAVEVPAAEARLAVDTPDAPAAPVLPTEPVGDAPRPLLAAPTDEAPRHRAATAGPRVQATVSAVGVPAATAVESSLAVSASVTRPPQDNAVPVAVDVAAATDAPRVTLPSVMSAPSESDEPVPVATALRSPDEMSASPVAVRARASASAVGAGLLAAAVPASPLKAAPLPGAAPPSPARPAGGEPTRAAPAPSAALTPLTDLLPEGKLASPDTFFQRSAEQRQNFIEAMGGSQESEAAVARALAFLAKHQSDDGHWPFRPEDRNKRRSRTDIALTGLAALCFLAADHRPDRDGPYKETVKKALDYMVARQKPDGDLRFGGDMYSHGIAALAVGEAAAMTGDPVYRAAAIKAGRFIVNAQHPATGGWRYRPRESGDTSVFGWQVMALHSIEAAGVKMPERTRTRAFRWLSRVTRSKHRMLSGYQNHSPTPRMTAEAVISRIFLGQQLTAAEAKEATDYLKFAPKRQRNKADYYYWYYGSLALSQIGGEPWRQWNEQMRETLIDLQRKDGSWNERISQYGKRGGVFYATAMSTLSLEVYYRYLPTYKADR